MRPCCTHHGCALGDLWVYGVAKHPLAPLVTPICTFGICHGCEMGAVDSSPIMHPHAPSLHCMGAPMAPIGAYIADKGALGAALG